MKTTAKTISVKYAKTLLTTLAKLDEKGIANTTHDLTENEKKQIHTY